MCGRERKEGEEGRKRRMRDEARKGGRREEGGGGGGTANNVGGGKKTNIDKSSKPSCPHVVFGFSCLIPSLCLDLYTGRISKNTF